MNDSGFSRQLLPTLRYLNSLRITLSRCTAVLPAVPVPRLLPDSIPGRVPSLCPHSSVISQCRNLNLLSIDYAFRPRLRPRLTQGRSALPWIPWIFGHKDSHLILATHSGILSSGTSTAPSGTASVIPQCSPTNHLSMIPELRCRVSAPVIFGAGPLG